MAVQFLVQFAILGGPVNSYSARHPVWFWIVTAAELAVPVALAAGLLWAAAPAQASPTWWSSSSARRPARFGDALARTLGDPTLELALWLPERRSYVDASGRPFELPAPEADRAVTVLGPTDAPVAALIHDPVLLERRRLLHAAGAAARLALENERLQAELRAQLAELRASRNGSSAPATRSAAGSSATSTTAHNNACSRSGWRSNSHAASSERTPTAPASCDEADGELRAALDELRELARGIHPAVLTEQGLGAALRSLAERSPIPVKINASPETRLPAAAEAAVYFLVSEALANVAKYARASRVRVNVARTNGKVLVEVDDNGIGGADPPAAPACAASPTASIHSTANSESTALGTRHKPPRDDPMRVALADDATVLREGLARVLAEAGIEVAAQVGTADELLTAIDQLGPDVAVVDIRMPPTWSDEGLEVAEEIRRRFLEVGVLLLSQYVEAEYALRLLEGGSERIGYLLKERMLDIGDLALRRTLPARRLSTLPSSPNSSIAAGPTTRSINLPGASAKSSR